MVFTHLVADRSGDPRIFITEDLDAEPEDRSAQAIRITWKLIRYNALSARCVAVHYARIQDGASGAYERNLEDHVPEEHLNEMLREVQMYYLDAGITKPVDVEFPQFEQEVQANPEPVNTEEEAGGSDV